MACEVFCVYLSFHNVLKALNFLLINNNCKFAASKSHHCEESEAIL